MKDAYTPEETAALEPALSEARNNFVKGSFEIARVEWRKPSAERVFDEYVLPLIVLKVRAESEVAALTAEVVQLRKDKQNLQSIHSSMSGELSDINSDNNRLREELAQVKAAHNDLVEKYDKELERWIQRDTDIRATVTSQSATTEELRKALLDIYSTLNSDDTMLCQILPEKDSFYKPDLWLTMARAALSRSAKPTGE